MKLFSILFLLTVSMVVNNSHAADYRSTEYCAQLADIGKKVYLAKQDGHSLSAISSTVSNGLAHDKGRQTIAVGVVMSVYGDSSITSSSEAYQIVFDSCSR